MKKPIIILSVLLSSVLSWSQELYLDALVTSDSIVLRWAPDALQGFEKGITNGYVLEKIAWKGEKFIAIDTIRPASAYSAEAIIDDNPEDEAALIAAYYLHGDGEKGDQQFSNILQGFQNHNDRQINLNLILTAADLSIHAAEILGLRYSMQNLKPNQKAIYRLRSLGIEKSDTANYLFTGELSYFPTIDQLDFDQNGKKLQVKWDNLTYQNYYTAYDLYRSTSLGGTYNKVNDAPIFQGDAEALKVIQKDSLEIGKTYYYKVQGRTAFGTKNMLSEAFEYKMLDQDVGFRVLGLKARGNHKSIAVEWQPEIENSTSIQTVKLLKANSLEGPYKEIGQGQISLNTTQYKDQNIQDERIHYYRIAAQNRDGFWYHSNPIRAVYEDEVAPDIPTDLLGVIDSSGICFIHWKANEAADLKGYRVYKSNRKDGTFYHAHDLLNYTNTFIDTVGIEYLTEALYYKIVAVDYDNNHSDYSDLLILNRPDLVPPVPAQIYKYEVVDQGLKISIHNSPSKDVEYVYLEKYTSDSTNITSLEIDKDQSFFIDQNFEKGIVTTYQIRTIDDAENSTVSLPITVRSQSKKSLLNSIEANYEEGKIQLEWTISKDDAGHVLLYLQPIDSENFEYLSKLPVKEKSASLRWSNKGQYKVACVLLSEHGKRYPPIFSNPITVE